MNQELSAIEALPEPEFLEGRLPDYGERMLALVAHIGAVFTSFIVPAVLYLEQQHKSAFVARHAREALNHQISICVEALLLYAVGAGLFGLLYAADIAWHWCLLAACLLALAVTVAVLAFEIVLAIRACQAAWKGRDYRYPLTLRFI